MRAADVMAQPVLTVRPETTVAAAARLMLERGISGLPVVNERGRVIGMVTEGDLLRRAETGTERRRGRWVELLLGPGRLAAEYAQAHGRKVAEVMTRDVVAVAPDTPLDEVVALMERRRVKRLPVLEGEKLVGILSRANLLRALASLAGGAAPAAAGDAEIRAALLAEFDRQHWAPRATVDVVVHDGVVDLWGSILDEREREALRVCAENVPGVKEVRDHLIWIEPVSGMVVNPPEADTAAE